jgi:serine/threonine protein phosphatase PrpC
MLCSDGVTSYLTDDEIAGAGAAVRYDPRALVGRLFATAIDRGGEDDLSAVVLTRKKA